MATSTIRKAAVIGSGVMGSGIAAHLANAGIECYLLDIVPPEPGEDDDVDDPEFRNRIARENKQKLEEQSPSPIYTERDLDLITPGNTEDHLDWLGEVDWVVEAVPEVMDIKQSTFSDIEEHIAEDAIISSNTSGLSIEGMLEGRSDDFRSRFLVTHFFNPVRYMKLLEIVEGPETDQQVVDTMVRFGENVLGKGIVFGKDTTNFVANRIGVHGIMSILHGMDDYDMTVEGVDVVFGKPMARPKSAVFRTADMVGLDTLKHVADNCWESLEDDEDRDVFEVPEFMETLVDEGRTGQKAGAGFYKKTDEGIETVKLEEGSLEYRDRDKPSFDSTDEAKKKDDPADRVRTFLKDGEDRAANFAREVTFKSIAYTARRLGEIADDVLNIDRAMRWGFNWDLGPFEVWDALGVEWTVDRMNDQGLELPGWVDEMVDQGVESFYRWEDDTKYFYDVFDGEYHEVGRSERELSVDLLKRSEGDNKVLGNSSASLYDMGDGVALLEFHSQKNAIDPDLIEMIFKSVDEVEDNWKGLVVGNDADNFSVGANLMLVYMNAQSGNWDDIESMVENFQQANQRMRYSHKPIVAAPRGMTLGGGAEVAMGADGIQAAGELYMGLVEVGVGLIPGGSGNLQLMRNVFGMHADDEDFNAQPFLQKIFMTIGMGEVAKSCEKAREYGFLTGDDRVTINDDHLLYEAKQRVLGMADSGYRPPRPTKFRLPGADGIATIDMMLYSMEQSDRISAHDRLIGKKLANVICGGRHASPAMLTDEETILELEREAFMSLCGEEKSQERMQHMIQHNKPLRN